MGRGKGKEKWESWEREEGLILGTTSCCMYDIQKGMIRMKGIR